MHILAIRGGNLASLAKPFEIDLTTSPLADAGLFAITGDTGAGKSTILDCLCLALYADFPRVAIQSAEEAPDPGVKMTETDEANTKKAKKFLVSDARTILRRGAADGFAEVDFRGRDDRRYRARWAVQRARGKSDGNLQAAQRSLICLDDNNVLANKTDVTAAVVEKTGLTFDQFCRTVLLAQGDFDKFLLASEKDRAELLEMITGTTIYSEISMRIFEQTAERRQTVATLLDRRVQMATHDNVLSDDVRAELTAECAGTADALALKASELAALADRNGRIERLLAAQQAVALAEANVARTSAALAAVATDRDHMKRLDAVEPLEGLAKAHALAAERARDADDRLAAAKADWDRAKVAADVATEALNARVNDDAIAAQTIAALEPQWDEAAALDIQIEQASTETARAKALVDKTSAEHEERNAALVDINRQIGLGEAALVELAGNVAASAPHKALATAQSDVTRWLDERLGLTTQQASAQLQLRNARLEQQRIEALLVATEATRSAEAGRRDDLTKQLLTQRTALLAADETGLLETERHLQALAALVRQGATIAATYELSQTALTAARHQSTQATAARTAATADRQNAEAALHAAQQARQDISALLNLAEATASAHVIAVRELLIDDQPCPVCGAPDHPYVQTGRDAALVAEARRMRQTHDEQVAHATAAVHETAADEARATARQQEAERVIADAGPQTQRQQAAYAALLPKLRAATVPRDVPFTPALQLTATTAAQFTGTLDLISQRTDHSASLRERINQVRRDVDALQAAHDKIGPTLDKLAAETATLRAGISATAQTIAKHSALDTAASNQLDIVTAALKPYLATADLALADLDRDSPSATKHLISLADGYRLVTEQHAQQVARLATLAPTKDRALFDVQTAHNAVEAAARALDERQRTLAGARTRRDELLDGETTAAHRDRNRAARQQAANALDNAAKAHASTAAMLAASVARHHEAEATASTARSDVAQALALLTTAADGIGHSIEDIRRLLEQPMSARQALRLHLGALERSASDAATARQSRQNDCDAARASALAGHSDATSDTDVAASLAAGKLAADACQDDINALHARRAITADKLERDATLRSRSDDLAQQIDVAQTDLDVWQDVNKSVGSANGDTFRKFAQGVTLDQLVQLANSQLTEINPRFQLVRSTTSDLGLHMRDRELGDDTRAVRSLSGGERFLVSLALALALASLEGKTSFVDTLFIDEGFGSLDAETLDMAIGALETLKSQGRRVGVITHVAAMIDRISVKIRVEKRGNGRSVVQIDDGSRGMFSAAA
jgi:DNA repair protein SbcC/Rad50